MQALVGRRIERAAGTLSMGAGLLHGLAAPAHFAAWWGYGLFFVFAASGQILFGLALCTDAINESDSGPRWKSLKAALLFVGVGANFAILSLYVITRSRGIPLGPEAGFVEAVGPLDAVSKAFEVAVLVLLALLLWPRLYNSAS